MDGEVHFRIGLRSEKLNGDLTFLSPIWDMTLTCVNKINVHMELKLGVIFSFFPGLELIRAFGFRDVLLFHVWES